MITATPDEAMKHVHDGVRAMTASERDSVLARMGLAATPPSIASLTRLQWAMLRTSPFHNIELLAARSGHSAPRDAESCIQSVLRGAGGPCHVQATGFLALLRSLGYSAHLAAATIQAPGDHFVVIVRIGEESYVCDVGNGHPYEKPFPLHEPIAIERFGWRFTTTVDAHNLTLTRWFADGASKVVYRVDPRPRVLSDFAETVRRHHEEPGFGPFLLAIRAVRIGEHVMLTLRGGEYDRHSIHGSTKRKVADAHATMALLRGPFGLGDLPLEAAMSAPTLRAGEAPTATADEARSVAQDHARILVSFSTTDRPDALAELTQSVLAELDRTRYAGWPSQRAVSLLIVENSRHADHRVSNRHILERVAKQGLPVELVDDGRYDRRIGESRTRQVQAIIDLERRGNAADAWWMIDDDTCFAQLRLDAEGSLKTVQDVDYFRSIDRYVRERPEVAMVLGGVTGDPPIRPEAVVRVQLFDVLANLEWFESLVPDAPYLVHVRAAGFRIPDYYYDHRQDGDEHLTEPFLWLPRTSPAGSVVDEMVGFLTEASQIAWGRSVTRPLLLGTAAVIDRERPGCRRGGNTIFLDRDAMLSHTYPSFLVGGVQTRRSDMLGASLLAGDGCTMVLEAPLPLLHKRGATQAPADRGDVMRSMLAEFYGVLAARAVMSGRGDAGCAELRRAAEERANLVIARLTAAGGLLDRLLLRLDQSRGAWWERHEKTAAPVAMLRDCSKALAETLFGGRTPRQRQDWLRLVESELRSPARIEALAAGLSTLGSQCAAHHRTVAAWLAGRNP